MEKVEYDLKKELNEYAIKNGIYFDELQSAIETVEDLLLMFIKDTTVNEPQATNSLNRLINAKSEVTMLYHEITDLLE